MLGDKAFGAAVMVAQIVTLRSILTQLPALARLNQAAALLLVALLLGIGAPLRGDDFPQPYNSEAEAGTLLAPEEALKKIVLPEGLRATLFAHEPEVQNPIAMSFDGRGRLWIAENYTYAERGVRFDLKLRDRVIILADEDGDGRADSRRIFSDDLQMLTGLVVVPEGVWLMCPPKLLFVPDRNGDDQPDGPAQEVLDGFTVAQENYHNFANGLKVGPDGWLYGRCGASCPGEVGPPGSAPEERHRHGQKNARKVNLLPSVAGVDRAAA